MDALSAMGLASQPALEEITFHPDAEHAASGPRVEPEPARTDPVTVLIGGASAGTVTSSPGGINCAGSTVSCTGWFPEGTSLTLTATPDTGLVFVGWAGACSGTGLCSITVNGPQTVVANFASPLQYYHLDVLGSVRMITNAAGAVVTRHDYYAFGEDTAAMTGDPRRFTGKELDSETALQYFGARYYRNVWGRFTSPDPVMDVALALVAPERWNRYANALNSPLTYVDGNGKWPTKVHNAVISSAFPELSALELRAILVGNGAVDNLFLGQLTGNAFMHGMSSVGQDDSKARGLTDAFIAVRESRAQNFAAAGHWTQGLTQFGMMQHPVIDRLSPAHAGEQDWPGLEIANVQLPGLFAAMAVMHAFAEGGPISKKEFEALVNAERQRYLKAFGAEKFHAATGCNAVQGCPISFPDWIKGGF